MKEGRKAVDTPKQTVVSYENLMGMVARSVFYRPERRRVRDLVSRKAQPQLNIDGVRFPLFDLSMNGASFLDSEAGDRWPIGKVVDVTLLLHDDDVFSGAARVARTEVGPRGTLVGLALIGGFLDLPEIQRRDDEKKLDEFRRKAHDNLALDHGEALVYIAPTRVNLELTQERWPDIRFRATREL